MVALDNFVLCVYVSTESGDGESGSGGGMIDSSGCEDDDRDVVKAKEVCSKNLMVVVVAAVPVLVIILTVAALLTLVCVWKRQHRLRKSPLYLGSCRRLPSKQSVSLYV